MKRLVLLGGGHAHVKVLADLAGRRPEGWKIDLISPYRRQIYSGMLPGWVAGHYSIDDCAISLARLAGDYGVRLHESAGLAIDLGRNEVECGDGVRRPFDLLSIDTGPCPATLPGSTAHALPIRPIEGFVAAWPGLMERVGGTCRRFELVVIGAGAAGVELAFAIRHRARVDGWSHLKLTLVGPEDLPLDGTPPALRRQVARLLVRHGIAWQGGRRALGVAPGRVEFEQGAPQGFDECLVVTGAAAPTWAAASGLATDERGFIRVGPSLQSVSHPQVFAAGDVVAYADPRPKSGVYAVRAGPVLAENLRAACEGRAARPWRPQRRALYLISTGGRHALASWGPWSFGGDWVWRWKDRIDRRFMRRFAGA